MKTCGEFNITGYKIPLSSTDTPARIIPFGDIHMGADGFAKSKWSEFCKYCRDLDPDNTYYIGMGDYFDFASTSERNILNNPGIHESNIVEFDRAHMQKVNTFIGQVEFMKGRTIGMLEGNHTWKFLDGQTETDKLAVALDSTRLGVAGFMRLTCEYHDCRTNVDILAHHGLGGGVLLGSSFNKVEKMQGVMDADIYLMGHDHGRGIIPGRPIMWIKSINGGESHDVRERQRWFGRTGSFLKAWEQGKPSYIVDICKPASDLGHIEFLLYPKRTKDDGYYIQIKGLS